MADEGRDDDGDGKECSAVVLRSISDPVNNGFSIPVENGFSGDGYSAGSSCEALRTYKRRRFTKKSNSDPKLPEVLKVAEEPVDTHLIETTAEEKDHVLHSVTELGKCPLNRWKNIVLEQLYQSTCESEGGLKGCIQDALRFHPGSTCGPATEGTAVHPYENERNNKGSSEIRWTTAVKPHEDGTPSESNHTNTDLCQRAFFDIIMSEKFAQLCRLLLENFEGVKLDKFWDISLLNSRMKEGTYEESPKLFLSDTQQLCSKLQKVGAEMVALGKSLSENSKMCYSQQFRNSEPDLHSRPGKLEASSMNKHSACRQCGEKENGRDCLVCDSCEDMYHVSCIEPALDEFPNKSWYCANCTVAGVGSPHDCCAVCEKLKASRPLENELEGDMNNNKSSKLDGMQICEKFEECKVCGGEVDHNVNFRVCGHPQCPHKYYHVSCLTGKQLRTYGLRWYCPSCLCRGCLVDKDDEKIVLCDGCDHAYHIYCMQPVRTSVPRGKWFCKKCEAGLKRVRKAKRAFENVENKLMIGGGGGGGGAASRSTTQEEDGGDRDSKSVDNMDVLLDAARALNFEDQVAATGSKS